MTKVAMRKHFFSSRVRDWIQINLVSFVRAKVLYIEKMFAPNHPTYGAKFAQLAFLHKKCRTKKVIGFLSPSI